MALLVAAALLALPACAEETTAPSDGVTMGDDPCPNEGGQLTLTVSGSLQREVGWSGPAMRCAGMPRPEGEGLRFRFGASDDPLVLLLGFDTVNPGADAPANVTLFVEDSGRFFSSQKKEGCFARIMTQESVSEWPGVERVSGLAWCISPLRQVNGPGEVRVSDIAFAGFTPWPREAQETNGDDQG